MPIDRTAYNLLVDDSGGNLDGTIWTKNQVKTVILDPIDALITDPAAFTPTIISSGGGAPTYAVQVGRYARENGWVKVTGRVALATFGTLAAGSVSIGGLPVASANVANVYSMAQIQWGALTTAAVAVMGAIAPNSTTISLNFTTAAAGSVAGMTKADLSAASDLIFSASYPSA